MKAWGRPSSRDGRPTSLPAQQDTGRSLQRRLGRRARRRRLPQQALPAPPPGPSRPGAAPRPRSTFSFAKTSTAALNTLSSLLVVAAAAAAAAAASTQPGHVSRSEPRPAPTPRADWPAQLPIKCQPVLLPPTRLRRGPGVAREWPGDAAHPSPNAPFPWAAAPPRRLTSRKGAEPGLALSSPLVRDPPARARGGGCGRESAFQERALLP